MTKKRLKILVIASGLLAIVSVVYGQFAIPISNNVVEGDLFLPGAVSAHFQLREGTMLTVRNEAQGRWYGVVPVIDEQNDVNLTGFTLEPHPEGPHVKEVFSGIEAQKDLRTTFSIQDYELAISIKKVFAAKFPTIPLTDAQGANPVALQKVYGASGGGLCSLTCGDITVTATTVQMSCGYCEGAR